jgi:AcrR family transcriptional regulator
MTSDLVEAQPGRQAQPGREAQPGRRERKKLATRQALQDAALRLVAERGLEQATVEDISEAADVATRTFFNYFSSKEEALLGDAPQNAVTVHRLVVERPAGESPLEAVCQVLRAMILGLAERREESLLRQQVIERHPGLLARQLGVYASFERALAAAVAERLGPDRADPSYARLVAAVAVAAARSAVSSWRAGQGRRPLAELADAAFAQLRDLGSPPAPSRSRRRRGTPHAG